MAPRFISSLFALLSANGQNFFIASPGYSCSNVITGGSAATSVTIPTGYRSVFFSAQGALFYVNFNGVTATGTGTSNTVGTADLETPAQLALYDETNTLLTSLSIYAPVTCTVFMRFYK